jgi:hypothetical protein
MVDEFTVNEETGVDGDFAFESVVVEFVSIRHGERELDVVDNGEGVLISATGTSGPPDRKTSAWGPGETCHSNYSSFPSVFSRSSLPDLLSRIGRIRETGITARSITADGCYLLLLDNTTR